MDLFELIEVKFSESILENKDKVNTIKTKINNSLDNLLLLKKELFDHYLILITETNILTKHDDKYNSNIHFINNYNNNLKNAEMIKCKFLDISEIKSSNNYNVDMLIDEYTVYDNDYDADDANDANDADDADDANDADDADDANDANDADDADDANDADDADADDAVDTGDIDGANKPDFYELENECNITNEELNILLNQSLSIDNIDFIKNEIKDKQLILKNKQFIQLHFFIKKYDKYSKVKFNTNLIKYITSFHLNDDYPYIAYDSNINDQQLTKMCESNFYSNTYKDYDDFSNHNLLICNYLDNFYEFDEELFKNLEKLFTGYHLNINNIGWQIMFRTMITSKTDIDLINLKNENYSNFKLGTTIDHYIPNYISTNESVFSKKINEVFILVCDSCNVIISNNFSQKYYSNSHVGDLCEECYTLKKNKFYNRLKYLKKKMLLVGKIIVFKRELENMQAFLKKHKIKKIKKSNYYKLLEKTNNELIKNYKQSSNNNFCYICCDTLRSPIYCASACGHVFHKTCVDNGLLENCPICRTPTFFINIFINL